MSDELRLPDDLAACEARLAAMPLPASRIDRDELMYRAGWAAALAGGAGASTSSARLAALDPPPSKGGAKGGMSSFNRSTAAASLASAALAASLAVVLTLRLQSREGSGLAAKPADPRPQLAVDADVQLPSPAPRVEPVLRRSTPVNLAGLESGLIGLRQQAIMNAWPPQASVAASLGDSTAAPPTARDILQDLLPAESPRRTGIWPWKLTPLGESI